MRDSPSEGLAWFDRALTDAGNLPLDLRATALMTASTLAHAVGSPRAVELAEQSIALWDEAGDDPAGRAFAIAMLALAYDNLDEHERADIAFDDAVAAHRKTGDDSAVGLMLSNQARVRGNLGDSETARELAAAALDMQLAAGNAWALGIARNAVGRLAAARNDDDEVLRQFVANLRPNNPHGDKRISAEAVAWIGIVAQRRGLSRRASRLLGAADAANVVLGTRARMNLSLAAAREAEAQARSELGDTAFELAYAEGRVLSLDEAEQEALAVAAELR
jgi:hypothetical protein